MTARSIVLLDSCPSGKHQCQGMVCDGLNMLGWMGWVGWVRLGYNNFMTEKRTHRTRKENLKTEVSSSSRGPEIELGKLVRLPYIRRTSNQHKQLDNKSLENRETRVMRNSNKELLLQHTHTNMLTLQEIELCKDCSLEKEGFPRIATYHPIPRERSIESLELSLGTRDKKSLTRLEFNDRLPDYKLGPIVGKGTYSVVRAARNKEGRKVAVKTYLKTSLGNEDRRRNIENEIAVLSQLEHPCILSYTEYVETDNAVSIVSELLENQSLADYLKGEGCQGMPEEIAKLMVRQLVKALVYCHSKDIVHRDLKLENVLVSKDFKVKLIDFGFGLQLDQHTHILYDYCGTPHYIAPEVSQREGYYGKPADVWSLGVVLYRMVVGAFPFPTRPPKDKHHPKPPKHELKLPSELSPELSHLLGHMLNWEFWKRPTAEEILSSEWLQR